jgi:hypothetical protein
MKELDRNRLPINIVELASELASERLIRETGLSESEMSVYDEDLDSYQYKDIYKEIFDHWYEFFENKIVNSRVWEEV